MKIRQQRVNVTLKNGKLLDYIIAVKIYEKLTGLVVELQEGAYFNSSKSYGRNEDSNTPKISELTESQKTRKNSIACLFKELNQCQTIQQITVEFGQMLFSLKVVPCMHQISTDYYSIVLEMIISGMVYKNNKLLSPFSSDVISIKGIELAEVILSMCKIGLPVLSRHSPRMKELTIWSARECVQKRVASNQSCYFDDIDLGAGPVTLNIRVDQREHTIDVTEFNRGCAYGQIALANVMKKQQMFCHFTGYSKGQFKILDITRDMEKGVCSFLLRYTSLIEFKQHDNIQLDGVLACITKVNKYTITVCTTDELIASTSLSAVKKDDLVNIGLSAMNEVLENTHYLLEASVMGSVELVSSHQQEGHEYTWQLNFKALNLHGEIANDQHLGLAGVSLTAKNVSHQANLTRFSIFCGRQTREQTQFNESMAVGTRINFTPRVQR